MKVRIVETPHQREIDGVPLDSMKPGSTREVSASVGAWLIAEGYAEPEMRQTQRHDDLAYQGQGDTRVDRRKHNR